MRLSRLQNGNRKSRLNPSLDGFVLIVSLAYLYAGAYGGRPCFYDFIDKLVIYLNCLLELHEVLPCWHYFVTVETESDQ